MWQRGASCDDRSNVIWNLSFEDAMDSNSTSAAVSISRDMSKHFSVAAKHDMENMCVSPPFAADKHRQACFTSRPCLCAFVFAMAWKGKWGGYSEDWNAPSSWAAPPRKGKSPSKKGYKSGKSKGGEDHWIPEEDDFGVSGPVYGATSQ